MHGRGEPYYSLQPAVQGGFVIEKEREVRSSLVREEVESDIGRQLRALRELSEAPCPEAPGLGARSPRAARLGAPGLGACSLCEALLPLHLLPLHHGVPHHLPCLLHCGRHYTTEEDRHQHYLSCRAAHLSTVAAHQQPWPTGALPPAMPTGTPSPAWPTEAPDLATRLQVTLHQEEGERPSDERAVLTSSPDSAISSSSVSTSSGSSWSTDQSVPDLRSQLQCRGGRERPRSASRGGEVRRRSPPRGEEVRNRRRSTSRGEEERRKRRGSNSWGEEDLEKGGDLKRIILLEDLAEGKVDDGMVMCGDGLASFYDEVSDEDSDTKPVMEARYQPAEWCRVCEVQVPTGGATVHREGARHRVGVEARRLAMPPKASWCEVCEVQVVTGIANWRMHEGGQRHRQLVNEAPHRNIKASPPADLRPQPYWCEVCEEQVASRSMHEEGRKHIRLINWCKVCEVQLAPPSCTVQVPKGTWKVHQEGRRHRQLVGEEQESRGQELVEEAPPKNIKVSPPVGPGEGEGGEEAEVRWRDDGNDYGRKRGPSDLGRRDERVKYELPSDQERRRVKEHTSHNHGVRRGEGVREEGEQRRSFTDWREQELQEEFILDLNELKRKIKSAKKENSDGEGKPGRRKIVWDLA